MPEEVGFWKIKNFKPIQTPEDDGYSNLVQKRDFVEEILLDAIKIIKCINEN